VIVVDFPDPTNFAIGKLYTNSFYGLLERLAASGYAVVQTTSPLIAGAASGPWCRPSSRWA
jgi:spermidine synthase